MATCGWVRGGRASLKVTPRGRNKTQEKLKPPASVCPGASPYLDGTEGRAALQLPTPHSCPRPLSAGPEKPRLGVGLARGSRPWPHCPRAPPPPAQPCPWQLSPSNPAGTRLQAGPVVASCRGRWAEVTQESESLGRARVPRSQQSGGRGSRLPSCVCNSSVAREGPGDPHSVMTSQGLLCPRQQPLQGMGNGASASVLLTPAELGGRRPGSAAAPEL